MRRMCYAFLRDEDEAQDAVQETFLKAYKAMAAFRGECNEKTWLMRRERAK
ncbi:MAG: sigma factor [Clostridia bacterium]